MTVAALLAVAVLSAPGTPRAPADPAPPRAPAAQKAKAPLCTRYRAQAEKNALAPEADVAAWASAALEKAGLLDPASPCFLHVRITAMPLHTGGREDGWAAHVAASVRRYTKDGKLVTRERGTLAVEPTRDPLLAKARRLVEEFAASLAQPTQEGPEPLGSDRG